MSGTSFQGAEVTWPVPAPLGPGCSVPQLREKGEKSHAGPQPPKVLALVGSQRSHAREEAVLAASKRAVPSGAKERRDRPGGCAVGVGAVQRAQVCVRSWAFACE